MLVTVAGSVEAQEGVGGFVQTMLDQGPRGRAPAEAFEARIREVSSDPEVAREYTEAFDAVIDRSSSSDP